MGTEPPGGSEPSSPSSATGSLPPAYESMGSRVYLDSQTMESVREQWKTCPLPLKIDLNDEDVRAASSEAFSYVYALPFLPVPVMAPKLFMLIRGATSEETGVLPVITVHEAMVTYILVLRLCIRGSPMQPPVAPAKHTVDAYRKHNQEQQEAAELRAQMAFDIHGRLDAQLVEMTNEFQVHLLDLVERMRSTYQEDPLSRSVPDISNDEVTPDQLAEEMMRVSLSDPLTGAERRLSRALCSQSYLTMMNLLCVVEGAVACLLDVPSSLTPQLLVQEIRESAELFTDPRRDVQLSHEVLDSMRRQERDFLVSIEKQYRPRQPLPDELSPEDGGAPEPEKIMPPTERPINMHSHEQPQWPRDLLRGCAASHAYLHMLRYADEQWKAAELAAQEAAEPVPEREPTPAEVTENAARRRVEREQRLAREEYNEMLRRELEDEERALAAISLRATREHTPGPVARALRLQSPEPQQPPDYRVHGEPPRRYEDLTMEPPRRYEDLTVESLPDYINDPVAIAAPAEDDGQGGLPLAECAAPGLVEDEDEEMEPQDPQPARPE